MWPFIASVWCQYPTLLAHPSSTKSSSIREQADCSWSANVAKLMSEVERKTNADCKIGANVASIPDAVGAPERGGVVTAIGSWLAVGDAAGVQAAGTVDLG